MAFKTNTFQAYLANIPLLCIQNLLLEKRPSSLRKTSRISSKSANSLYYIVHLRILNWPLSPPGKQSVCSKRPTHTQQKARAPRNPFKYVKYLSHGLRPCVPLCTRGRVKIAFHSLWYPTAGVWSLEPFPYALLCGTASIHVHI